MNLATHVQTDVDVATTTGTRSCAGAIENGVDRSVCVQIGDAGRDLCTQNPVAVQVVDPEACPRFPEAAIEDRTLLNDET